MNSQFVPLTIFTSVENSSSIYFQILHSTVRDDVRDFGVHPFHAIPVEMGG